MSLEMVFVPSISLKKKSRPVLDEEFGPDLDSQMDQMIDKMDDMSGVGLAGVQVGDPRRILVMKAGERHIKMVNPIIMSSSEETAVFEEGCLSFPALYIAMQRKESVKISYQTPTGDVVEEEFSDLEAAIVQHEMDHFEGISILDSVSRLKRDMYKKKIKKYKKKIERRLKEGSLR
jgi:peptide deformylase